MNDYVAKFPTAFAGLLGLVAVALAVGSGYATAGMGQTIGLAIFFAIFAAAGFAASFATKAGKGTAILVMIVAALITGGVYYGIVSSTMAEATETLSAGVGAQGDEASEAGGIMGAFFGIVVAIVAMADALVAGIGGAIAGAKVKAQLLGR